MTRAEPGCTLAQNFWRSALQACSRGTAARMSCEASSMVSFTRCWHSGDFSSCLQGGLSSTENHRFVAIFGSTKSRDISLSACRTGSLFLIITA